MVKSSPFSTELYNTPKECIEAQFKKLKIVECYYVFHGSHSFTDVFDSSDGESVSPEKMLDLAVEQFNKYGNVQFDGLGEDNTYYSLGCWDESAHA